MDNLKLRIADKYDVDVLVKALVLSDIDEIEDIEASEIKECKKIIYFKRYPSPEIFTI
jgi:hypothetical protein